MWRVRPRGWALIPPIDYLPEGNRALVFVTVRTPPGYNLKQNGRILRLLEERFLPMPEVYRMFTVVRHKGPFMGIILGGAYKDKRSIRAFTERVRDLTRDPDEQSNLVGLGLGLEARWRERARQRFERMQAGSQHREESERSDQYIEELRALGYVE